MISPVEILHTNDYIGFQPCATEVEVYVVSTLLRFQHKGNWRKNTLWVQRQDAEVIKDALREEGLI